MKNGSEETPLTKHASGVTEDEETKSSSVEQQKRFPCLLNDGKVSPCFALDEVLQDPYGRGTRYQGISVHSMISMDTREFSRHLIVVKSGKHSKKGIILNFCPFCRAELLEGAEASLAASVAEQQA